MDDATRVMRILKAMKTPWMLSKDRVDEMRRMVRVRDEQLESNSREHEADIG